MISKDEVACPIRFERTTFSFGAKPEEDSLSPEEDSKSLISKSKNSPAKIRISSKEIPIIPTDAESPRYADATQPSTATTEKSPVDSITDTKEEKNGNEGGGSPMDPP